MRFSHLTVEQLAKSYKDGNDTGIKDATAELQKEVPASVAKWHPAQVCSAAPSTIEIVRPFVCLSSKELKKALGTERLTKALAGSLPCLKMPQQSNPAWSI